MFVDESITIRVLDFYSIYKSQNVVQSKSEIYSRNGQDNFRNAK